MGPVSIISSFLSLCTRCEGRPRLCRGEAPYMRLLLLVLMASTAKTAAFSFCLQRPLRAPLLRRASQLPRQPRALAADARHVVTVASGAEATLQQANGGVSVLEQLRLALRTKTTIAGRKLPTKAMIAAMHAAIPRPKGVTVPETGMRVDRRQLRIEDVTSDMEIVFLGTASTVPGIHRGVSCTALRFGSESWLFDVGEGSQIQIQKSVVRPSRVRRIFLTHLHGDHSWGLPGMLCLIGKDREADSERHQVVEVYGPEGVRQFLRTALELTYSKATPAFKVHELKPHPKGRRFQRTGAASISSGRTYNEQEGTDIYPDENGVYHLFDTGMVRVAAAQIKHSVPCFGYVVQEHDRPGTLRAAKVAELIRQNWDALEEKYGDAKKTNRFIKALKPGEEYTFPDGTIVGYDDVMEAPHRGRKVVILGDTSDPRNISELAQGADVLIHEATNNYLPCMDEGTTPKEVERDAKRHGHSTAEMAGRFARSIGARRLLLNHFSPRYQGDASTESVMVMAQIESLARKAMGSAEENSVIAAWDMLRVPIPINKPAKSESEHDSLRSEAISSG